MTGGPETADAGASAEGEAPGAVLFVTVRAGVSGILRLPGGGERPVPGGTVMRYLEGDERAASVQLPDGASGEMEVWQIRDASFEEAVRFYQSAR